VSGVKPWFIKPAMAKTFIAMHATTLNTLTTPPEYHIVYSRRRSLAIVVSNGQVTVRAPLGCNIMHIQQLVNDKQHWISRHLQRQQTVTPILTWQQRGTILLKGKRLPVTFSRGSKSEANLTAAGLNICVSRRVLDSAVIGWQNTLLAGWLLEQATAYFTESLQAWSKIMAVSYHKIKFGQWRRRWGYCDSNGVIGLNWQLVMAPEWVSDYVMVHELAHRLLMNHSPAFWEIVSHYIPNYPQAQAWLSFYQPQLLSR
jgi:predicted metal-dependent hydrolase